MSGDGTTPVETVQNGPLIRFEGVTKRFGDNVVLDGLDLQVAAGEKVCLIGPSGSGKTTILRMLMTLERPDRGAVWLDGQPLWHPELTRSRRAEEQRLRSMRQHVGMVFQQFNLFPHKNALDNVAEALIRVKGLSAVDAREQSRILLDQVGLGHRADAFPWQLSGGQQQRVAIARAIALKPRVLLCDEVTSALDPELVGEVQQVLSDLAETSKVTMLLVTHEMHFAQKFADRVLVFDHGRIVEQGPPAQVLQNPTHERTRRFLAALYSAT